MSEMYHQQQPSCTPKVAGGHPAVLQQACLWLMVARDVVGWGESGDGTVDGYVTNIHFSQLNIDGAVPRELCVFKRVREFDMKGGHLTGPLPHWTECLPGIQEFDLVNNRLTGTLPEYLTGMPAINEVRLNNNMMVGTIPAAFGLMRGLFRFEVQNNYLSGTIPTTFSQAAATLTQFGIGNNEFEGDLYMLNQSHLMRVWVDNNPKLCGMIPHSVRFAHGYNPVNTGLGKPCPPKAAAPVLPQSGR
eukprot:jgi/Chrzof1/7477/Cz02g25120.t1